MYAPIFTMYMGPMKVKETNFKTLNVLISCIFIHMTKPNAGVLGSPLKLLNCKHPKVRLTLSMPLLHPKGKIFFFFMRHLRFSCWNPARPWPGENTA